MVSDPYDTILTLEGSHLGPQKARKGPKKPFFGYK